MNSKPHYIILDGLRGVAAMMVLLYHLFEAVAFAAGQSEQNMFHGFLAVDFFFVLSGFVMGYAYDEKWSVMTISNFIKRRLVRLHPMVIIGVIIGLIAYIVQGCTNWNGDVIPISTILECFLLALFLLPSPSSLDIRGNTELFPLNGTHWSLFLEYIGSLLYAFALRKLKTIWLFVWTIFFLVCLLIVGLYGPYGYIAYGWSTDTMVFLGGLLRILFAYPLGLLLSRIFKNRKDYTKRNGFTFVVSAFLLCAILSVPSIPGRVYYEVFSIAVFFPIIIYFAATGNISNTFGKKIIVFLGDISYPLYAVHYPFIYLYIWMINNNMHPFGSITWLTPLVIALISILVAYLSFKLYDSPIRKYLSKKIS